MNKTIVEKMEEAMRRPVPYEGLLGWQVAPYGSRASESAEAKIARENEQQSRSLEMLVGQRRPE